MSKIEILAYALLALYVIVASLTSKDKRGYAGLYTPVRRKRKQ
jgi:hypothetical protein